MLVYTNNVNLNEGMIVAVVIAILSNCKLTPPPPPSQKKILWPLHYRCSAFF